MTPFRKLTSAETAALEALGNSAEDWSKVLVSEDFKPFQLLQSHLEGDVEIAAEARIVRSRVANYRIGTGSLVEGVTALECRRRSAFGNGVGVDVKAYDLIAAEGSVIDNGSIVERCFVGESCRLDKGFTAAESLFFANSHCENGEAASIFGGTYTVSHNK